MIQALKAYEDVLNFLITDQDLSHCDVVIDYSDCFSLSSG